MVKILSQRLMPGFMINEKPLASLLDRDLYSVLVKEQFTPTLELLEELVNYGSNLIPRCFESSDKKLHDLIILLNFVKQAVSLLDSIHILASKGSTTPCFISVRSLFEIWIYLEWIYQKETAKRGTLPYVWDIRKRLNWALSVKPGTREHEAHKKHMANTKVGPIPAGLDGATVDAQIFQLRAKLATPECAAINAEFDRLQSREWYGPGGVNNFREMAQAVGKEGEYKVIFGPFSGVTHGIAIDKHISFSKGQLFYEPIRNITGIHEILRHALNFGAYI
jgi:hypothetical protein